MTTGRAIGVVLRLLGLGILLVRISWRRGLLVRGRLLVGRLLRLLAARLLVVMVHRLTELLTELLENPHASETC